MHHGKCVMHVSWCMSGSLTRGGGENVPGIPGACATRNFTYLVRGSMGWKFHNYSAATLASICYIFSPNTQVKHPPGGASANFIKHTLWRVTQGNCTATFLALLVGITPLLLCIKTLETTATVFLPATFAVSTSCYTTQVDGLVQHDDVIKWKHFPRYWLFVRGIHQSSVNSPHKGQWRGALIFSLICDWINGWINNREAGDQTHYDVIVMKKDVTPVR